VLSTTVSTREQIVWETIEMLFYQSKIQYLGHVISDGGIVVDIVKVEAIMEWHASMNIPEVRSFTS
jgi:chemotaxis signal transduction protein